MRYCLFFLLVYIASTFFQGNISVVLEERIASTDKVGMISVIGSDSSNLEQNRDSFLKYIVDFLSGEKYPIVPKIMSFFSKVVCALLINIIFLPFYLIEYNNTKRLNTGLVVFGFFASLGFVYLVTGI